jgi:predicted nucleic acid-binding protein
MKDLFPWKFPLSEEEENALWENAIIIFDTSILLDFYRTSLSAAKEILEKLQIIQERFWIPNQVAKEFLDRYRGVVNTEKTTFKTALKNIDNWEKSQKGLGSLKNELGVGNRMISSELDKIFKSVQETDMTEILEAVEKIRKHVTKLQNLYVQSDFQEIEVMDLILKLFTDRIGSSYEKSELEKFYKEGEQRYKNKIPPGFKDVGKEGVKQFGDLIIWKEILKKAKKETKPVIFITSEKKEDWWELNENRQIKWPHESLRREFFEETDQVFYLYKFDNFLRIAMKRNLLSIGEESINEAESVSENFNANEETLPEGIYEYMIPGTIEFLKLRIKNNARHNFGRLSRFDPVFRQKYYQQLEDNQKERYETASKKILAHYESLKYIDEMNFSYSQLEIIHDAQEYCQTVIQEFGNFMQEKQILETSN